MQRVRFHETLPVGYPRLTFGVQSGASDSTASWKCTM